MSWVDCISEETAGIWTNLFPVLYLKKRMEAKQLCFLSVVVMSFIPQGAH